MSENKQLILINSDADMCVLLSHLSGRLPIPEAPVVFLDITKPFSQNYPTIRSPVSTAAKPDTPLYFCIQKEGMEEYIPYQHAEASPTKEVLHLPNAVLWDVLRMLTQAPQVALSEGSSQTLFNPGNVNMAGTITNHGGFIENRITLFLRGSDTEVTFVRRVSEDSRNLVTLGKPAARRQSTTDSRGICSYIFMCNNDGVNERHAFLNYATRSLKSRSDRFTMIDTKTGSVVSMHRHGRVEQRLVDSGTDPEKLESLLRGEYHFYGFEDKGGIHGFIVNRTTAEQEDLLGIRDKDRSALIEMAIALFMNPIGQVINLTLKDGSLVRMIAMD